MADEIFTAAAFLYSQDFIEEESFTAVTLSLKSESLNFPYWKYQHFDLKLMDMEECVVEFRFHKEDIPRLVEAFKIPAVIVCRNGTTASNIEGLCMLLKRFAYPCRYSDMIPRFGRSKSEICLITNWVMNHIYSNFGNLLCSFDQQWLAPVKLMEYAAAVFNRSKALENCWGFVDGTVRPICRPRQNQKVMYNGHKRVHALKYQAVVAANGLVANLYGPVEGKSHDAGILRQSSLLENLEMRCNSADGFPLCIYGDPAYPIRPHLQAPYKGNNLTEEELEFNKAMSSVRVSVEWVFGEIAEYFAFVDFKKNQKIALSQVGTMYKVCALLHNARSCLYGSATSRFFGIDSPSLEEYFQRRL